MPRNSPSWTATGSRTQHLLGDSALVLRIGHNQRKKRNKDRTSGPPGYALVLRSGLGLLNLNPTPRRSLNRRFTERARGGAPCPHERDRRTGVSPIYLLGTQIFSSSIPDTGGLTRHHKQSDLNRSGDLAGLAPVRAALTVDTESGPLYGLGNGRGVACGPYGPRTGRMQQLAACGGHPRIAHTPATPPRCRCCPSARAAAAERVAPRAAHDADDAEDGGGVG